ncbi:MAG: YeiH family protein [Aigarchaeota archaeon]|nr:YeiH family protein [Candidatus Geocrenenecus dongiae]
MPIDWSSLWRKEDWWAVWIGFIIIFIGLAAAAGTGWTAQPFYQPWIGWFLKSEAKWLPTPPAWVAAEHWIGWFIVLIYTMILTLIAVCAIEKRFVKEYIPGFIVVFILAWLAIIIGATEFAKYWGLEYPLWALIIGLLISNTVGVPKWLKPAVRTELFIKIGLVILGLNIFFTDLVIAGGLAVVQALINVLVIWYVAYYICRGFGLDREFSSIMATGVSICGVSAAIAAGGAVKGNPKYVSYTISLVLITAVPMLVGLPYIAKALAPVIGKYWLHVAGAWIGATIDTTPAVVAAGGFLGGRALDVAAIVKMAQNVLIGFVAFLLAIIWVFRVEKKPEERVSPMEVWYRFPKFILGFIISSIILSLVIVSVAGAMGITLAKAKSDFVAKFWASPVDKFRSVIFFPLAFVGIGLDTRFKELVSIGRGRPAVAYVIAQIINIIFSLFLVWLLWGGVFFTPPLAD